MEGKGVQLGLQYLPEGEYTLNGGLGNKVLKELKVEDGVLYSREVGETEWKVKTPPLFKEFKLPDYMLPKKKKSFFSKLFK